MGRIIILSLLGLLIGCQSLPPPHPLMVTGRFLLTFDDGPSAATDFNPTLAILQQLENNDVQPGIKAIFFVQTRNSNGGGTKLGKDIMRLAHKQGHILGLHSAAPAGHVGHLKMTPQELDDSLRNGKSDIRAITGDDPVFVRPPYWSYNPQVHALYVNNGFNMLLSDVKAHDGIIHVFNFDFFRYNHILSDLQNVYRAIGRGELLTVDGRIPITVTFHDVNTFTAAHLTEYLHILVEAAAAAGLPLDDRPFYDHTPELHEAAKQRAVPQFDHRPLVADNEMHPKEGLGKEQFKVANAPTDSKN
jgi:peptidoglycan/xylan/chitin deacetylase (PgdA/CDA1 family)